MKFNKTEIEKLLLKTTRKFLIELEVERALQAITLNASLERDLGIDSLGKVELFHRIEKTFSIQLPEDAIYKSDSLNDLIKVIQNPKVGLPLHKQERQFSPILDTLSFDLSASKTLNDILYFYAKKEPNRPHIYLQNDKGEEKIIRYEELFNEAQCIAKGLYERGIQQGETIAIMLPTGKEFFYAFFGILIAGAIPIPIYPPFRPDRIEAYAKREAKILSNAEVRILITFSEAKILSNILRSFVPSLKEVTDLNSLRSFKENLPTILIDNEDIAFIQYTSGSTGDPKGVTLTHKNILSNIRAIGETIPIKPIDVGVSWLPLYHDMGLMSWLGALYFGIPITILTPLTFLTRPERWLWAIHYHRATLSGAPNFAYELCVKRIDPEKIEGLDISSWRFAFNGAEAINRNTLERFSKKFSPYGFKIESFAPVYGLAESTVGLLFPKVKRTPVIDEIQRKSFENENKAIPSTDKKNSIAFVGCGEPLPGHNVHIVNDNGIELEDRNVGNIEFKGPSAMQGYYMKPHLTQKAFKKGWWDTGDLGYRVENEIFVTGRKKDLIIKAGRNLYPEEVEEVVTAVPNIRKGCVVAFGINDPSSGTERLVVVAETRELNKSKQQKIHTDILENMSDMLGIPPDLVILVPPRSVPKTSSGKLQRSACKQAYIDGKLTKHHASAKFQIAKLTVLSIFKKTYSILTTLAKLFYTFYASIILVFAIPMLWIMLFLLPQKSAQKLTKFSAGLYFRLIGCPVNTLGKENLKTNKSIIYVVNHCSYADSPLLLGILPAGVGFVAKQELLSFPILATFLKKFQYIMVDRVDFTKSLENTEQIKKFVKEGRSLIIFAEGTFTYATGLRRFKLGAFNIAVETGTPICPIAINGTRSFLRGNNFLAKPSKIEVTIGKPIHPKEKSWQEVMRLHSLSRAKIAKNCGEPSIDIIAAGPIVD